MIVLVIGAGEMLLYQIAADHICWRAVIGLLTFPLVSVSRMHNLLMIVHCSNSGH